MISTHSPQKNPKQPSCGYTLIDYLQDETLVSLSLYAKTHQQLLTYQANDEKLRSRVMQLENENKELRDLVRVLEKSKVGLVGDVETTQSDINDKVSMDGSTQVLIDHPTQGQDEKFIQGPSSVIQNELVHDSQVNLQNEAESHEQILASPTDLSLNTSVQMVVDALNDQDDTEAQLLSIDIQSKNQDEEPERTSPSLVQAQNISPREEVFNDLPDEIYVEEAITIPSNPSQTALIAETHKQIQENSALADRQDKISPTPSSSKKSREADDSININWEEYEDYFEVSFDAFQDTDLPPLHNPSDLRKESPPFSPKLNDNANIFIGDDGLRRLDFDAKLHHEVVSQNVGVSTLLLLGDISQTVENITQVAQTFDDDSIVYLDEVAQISDTITTPVIDRAEIRTSTPIDQSFTSMDHSSPRNAPAPSPINISMIEVAVNGIIPSAFLLNTLDVAVESSGSQIQDATLTEMSFRPSSLSIASTTPIPNVRVSNILDDLELNYIDPESPIGFSNLSADIKSPIAVSYQSLGDVYVANEESQSLLSSLPVTPFKTCENGISECDLTAVGNGYADSACDDGAAITE